MSISRGEILRKKKNKKRTKNEKNHGRSWEVNGRSWEVCGGSWEVSEGSWEVSGRSKGGHEWSPVGCRRSVGDHCKSNYVASLGVKF